MDAMVFSGQALLFRTSLFFRSKNKSGGTTFTCKEIKYAPTLFDKRKELLHLCAKQGDGERILPPHSNATKGRVPNGDGKEEVSSSTNARSSQNLEEIISLFRRIRSSISRESTSSKKRSRQSSEDTPSVESVFEVLREPQTRVKGRTTRQEEDKSLPGQTELLLDEQEGSSSALDPISRRSPSKTARSSPAPSPNVGESAFLGNESLLITTGEIRLPMQNVQEMKLPELKQLAKLRGIKGYSKLKKDDLVQLLSIT